MKEKLTNSLIAKLEVREKAYEVRDTVMAGFLLRVQPTGRMSFYLEYRNEAGKKLRSCIGQYGKYTLAQAREAAEKQAGNVVHGIDIQKAKKEARIEAQRRAAGTMNTFIENHYSAWIIANSRSGQKTIDILKRQFTEFLEMPLEDITPLAIEKWQTNRLKSGVKASTINRNVNALKAMLSKAIDWKIISFHPLTGLKRLKEQDNFVVRFLSKDEEAKLREAIAKRSWRMRQARESHNLWLEARHHEKKPDIFPKEYADHLEPMILLSMHTGLRRGELFQLRWENVDLSKCLLTVLGDTSKSNKLRHIPINKEAAAVLKKWQGRHKKIGLVFPNRDGLPFDNVNKAWKNLLKGAGIETFRWHDLRHTFASRLVMSGVDLNTVRELMGHSDIKMTLRYAHLAPEHKAEAVERLANYGK